MNIDDFRKAARDCKDCRTFGYLHKHEKLSRWSYPLFHEESSCPTRIVVIGEAQNYDDTYVHKNENLTWKDGKDETSKFTRELFDSIGLKTSDVLFTNSVLCLPARNKEGKYPVKAPQRRKCSKWLEMAINCCDAEIVVTIGAEALEAVKLLSRHKFKLKELKDVRDNNYWKKDEYLEKYKWNNRILFPLYHPSKQGRGNRSRDKQFADIQPLKEIISKLNLYTDKS